MFNSDPVGLPGLAALFAGVAAFTIALIAARRRRGPPDSGTQRRSRRSMIGIAIQCVAFFLVSFGVQHAMLDPLSTLALVEASIIAALMAATVGLFVWSSQTMGKNWSVVARTRSDHELVTTGPFAYLRHPIYTALGLFLIALAIATGNVERLVIGLPIYALGTWLRIVEEEKLLRAAFGASYDAYAGRVRRFVPGLL